MTKWLTTDRADLFFEDTSVGRLKKKIWEASEEEIDKILKINRNLRLKVKEITLDMAGSMKLIAKQCFPNATQVVDRFHVQKLDQ